MKTLYVYSVLLAAFCSAVKLSVAQQATDQWRLTKKIFTQASREKTTWEYSYDKDGRIQSVQTLDNRNKPAAAYTGMRFDNKNNLIFFVMQPARAGDAQQTIYQQFDAQGRIIGSRSTITTGGKETDVKIMTYEYTGNKIRITETPRNIPPSDIKPYNLITKEFNERGDMIEMVEEVPTTRRVFTITLNTDSGISADIYTGQLKTDAQLFGVVRHPSSPAIIYRKDGSGLVVLQEASVKVDGVTYTDRIEYTYTKFTPLIITKTGQQIDSVKIAKIFPKIPDPPKAEKIQQDTALTTLVKGKLFYRYKKENEQPVSVAFKLPEPYYSMTRGTTTLTKKDGGPYPPILGAQRFLRTNDNTTRPLAKARIRLVYRIMKTRSRNPVKLEEFKTLEDGVLGSFEKIFDLENNVVVATDETDANGNFSLSLFNNVKLGYLGSKKLVSVTHIPIPPKGYKDMDHDYGTWYFHGCLRLMIYEGQYCSPDLLLFPEKGKQLLLPDEIALVNSINVLATVRTDAGIADQALNTGQPIAGYPVLIGSDPKIYTHAPEPFEANMEKYTAAVTVDGENKILRVLDMNKTTGNGTYLFQNIVKSYHHIVQALESKFEGSFVYKKNEYFVAGGSGFGSDLFNSDFILETKKITINVQPKLPELYVRTIAKVKSGQSIGLANTPVFFSSSYPGNPWKSLPVKYATDKNGFLQLSDLPVILEKDATGKERVTGPLRRLVIDRPGYKKVYIPAANEKAQLLQWGQRWPNIEVSLVGTAAVTGFVKNEKGEGLAADIRVADGPFVPTKSFFGSQGWLSIDNCEAGKAVIIRILPAGDQYFAETITANLVAGETTNLGKIILKEKLHRIKFKVIDEAGKPIVNAKILFNNSYDNYPTDNNGLSPEIKIASPGTEFHVTINANGFAGYNDYVTVPVSKDAQVKTIKLVKGQVYRGYVTDAATKKPVNMARIYTITGYNEDGPIEAEAYTDEKGYYQLKGIPNPGSSLRDNNVTGRKITIYAVKSGTPLYLQQKQDVKTDQQAEVNFALQSLNCEHTIWGLPVELITAEKKNGNTYSLTGSFIGLQGNSSFRLVDGGYKFPFKNIAVKIEDNSSPGLDLKGVAKKLATIQPLADKIVLQTNTAKLILFDKFNCTLSGAMNNNAPGNLFIEKTGANCGALKGFVSTALESFNFSYKYNGRFFLVMRKQFIKDESKIINEKETGDYLIPVLASSTCTTVSAKYGLAPAESRQAFRINNFNADFRTGDSYVVRDTFSLGADILLNIPLVKTARMNVGSIKVLQNDITWNQYNGNIDLAIETWTLKGDGLSYDKNLGGFALLHASLQTNLPELPLQSILITPEEIKLSADAVSPGKITLAGVEPLYVNNVKPALVLDKAALHDQQPHWRLNLVSGSSLPVAYLKGIPGLADNDRINIGMLINYSDGKKNIAIESGVHQFFGVMQQNITAIESGADFFTLIGNTNLLIPGSNSNITGRFKYLKKNGVTVCEVEKLNTDIELSGRVKFSGGQSAADFSVQKNRFTSTGKLMIYEKGEADAIVVKATVIKTPDSTVLQITPLEKIKMGTTGTSRFFSIDKGGSRVDAANKNWDFVRFTAQMKGYDNLKPGEDRIDFLVQGALISDPVSDKKIGINDIPTPFGNFSLLFDFENKALAGKMVKTLATAPIVLGPVSVLEGTAHLQIDGNGLLIAGAFTNMAFTPVPLLNNIQGGMAVGFYNGALPDNIRKDLLGVSIFKQLPEALNGGLKGIYCNVSKAVPADPLDCPIGYGISLSGGADIRTYATYSNKKFQFGVDAYAFIEAKYGITIPVCGFTGLYGRIDLPGSLGYVSPSTFNAVLRPSIKIAATLCDQELPVTLGGVIGIQNNEFVFKLKFD